MTKDIYEQILRRGLPVTVKGKSTKECVGFDCVISDFNHLHSLDKNQRRYVNKKITKYKDKMGKVIKILVRDIYTRQAILMLESDKKLYPECLSSVQFIVREDKLFAIAYFRSVDVLKKLPQDIEIIRRFSELVERAIGVDLCLIKIFAGSAHYYN